MRPSLVLAVYLFAKCIIRYNIWLSQELTGHQDVPQEAESDRFAQLEPSMPHPQVNIPQMDSRYKHNNHGSIALAS